MNELKEKAKRLDKFKYPLIVLVLGVMLMLLPSGVSESGEDSGDTTLKTVLSHTRGVGRAEVLVSENGVVVVCDGAEDAKVRLDIIRAVGSYTGFGSDKITILIMTDQ